MNCTLYILRAGLAGTFGAETNPLRLSTSAEPFPSLGAAGEGFSPDSALTFPARVQSLASRRPPAAVLPLPAVPWMDGPQQPFLLQRVSVPLSLRRVLGRHTEGNS